MGLSREPVGLNEGRFVVLRIAPPPGWENRITAFYDSELDARAEAARLARMMEAEFEVAHLDRIATVKVAPAPVVWSDAPPDAWAMPPEDDPGPIGTEPKFQWADRIRAALPLGAFGEYGVEFADLLDAVHDAHPTSELEDIRRAVWQLLADGDLDLTRGGRVRRVGVTPDAESEAQTLVDRAAG